MKVKMLILCFGGFSTSLLINRFKKHLLPYGYEVEADAEPVEKGLRILNKYDIVLVGPQVKHMSEAVRKQAEKDNVPMLMIPMQEYAVDNPVNLIKQIVETLEGRKKND